MKHSDAAFLGIDFGTSNSAIATMVGGKIKPILVEPNKDTLPTAVFFDYELQKQQYGTVATNNLLEGAEGRYMRALKSVLGTSLMKESRLMLGKQMDFYDIISTFLAEIKHRAEVSENRSFDYVLSGRPVFFHSNDQKKDQQALDDLRQCYMRAGFKDVKFMFEPEAAAHVNCSVTKRRKLGLIVDIGGGTSDFCLFESGHDQPLEIIAAHGVRLGGTNFDKALSMAYFMPLLGHGAKIKKLMSDGFVTPPNSIYHDLATWGKIPFCYSRTLQNMVRDLTKQALEPQLFKRLTILIENRLGHELAFLAEAAKIKINDGSASTVIDLSLIEQNFEIEMSKQNLADAMAETCQTIAEHTHETLNKANCRIDDVDQVVFVGGSSQMLLIQATLGNIFPNAEMKTANIFTAVVDGLALNAERAFAS